MREEEEMVKVGTLARRWDCDRRTMMGVLAVVRRRHEVPGVVWNGVERVDVRAFRRAVLEEAVINFNRCRDYDE